jgi:hypothetical protein
LFVLSVCGVESALWSHASWLFSLSLPPHRPLSSSLPCLVCPVPSESAQRRGQSRSRRVGRTGQGQGQKHGKNHRCKRMSSYRARLDAGTPAPASRASSGCHGFRQQPHIRAVGAKKTLLVQRTAEEARTSDDFFGLSRNAAAQASVSDRQLNNTAASDSMLGVQRPSVG